MPSRTLEEVGHRLARYQWLEERLFELLGSWVPQVPEAEAKLLFRIHSFHHAWHAGIWERLAPAAVSAAPGDSGSEDFAAVLATSGAGGTNTTTRQKLTVAYEHLVPALAALYEHDRAAANPLSDGPLIRWLGIVIADLAADRQAGLSLLGTFAEP